MPLPSTVRYEAVDNDNAFFVDEYTPESMLLWGPVYVWNFEGNDPFLAGMFSSIRAAYFMRNEIEHSFADSSVQVFNNGERFEVLLT